jgi:DNA-binding winged helix-turn-helix (wHTH) protein/tetratricopeptide (TPR) repeat protein
MASPRSRQYGAVAPSAGEQKVRTDNPRPDSDIRLRFGLFELTGTELRTAEGRVPLQPQPLRLLHALARRPGEIVSREELRQHLWGGVHVDHEHGLNFAVRQLRVALGDRPDAPRFVETVPKVGYRFIAAVEQVREPPGGAPIGRRVLAAASALAVVAALAATLPGLRGDAAPPRILVRPVAGAPGLADEVIFELARLPPAELAVFAASTAAAAASPRTVRATHVVEGAADGGVAEVRLTASADGRVVWAGRVDPASPFAAARLAREVAVALDAPRLSLPPRRVDASLREGWRLLRLGSPDDAARARTHFERAAREEPTSAEAQIGLAESWRRLALPARETSPGWRAAAERALALDPDDARGHLSLAGYQLYRERDLAASRASFERALALAPGSADVADAYAAWFSAQGRHEEALSLARRAAELDPLSTRIQLDLGWYLYLARRHQDAATALLRAFELEGNVGCLDYALRALLAEGERQEARALALRVMQARVAPAAAIERVRTAPDARQGVQHFLRWNVERLESRAASKGVLALERAWLGDHAAALRLLEEAFAEGGDWVLCFLTVDPAWDGLADQPAFQALVARIGIGLAPAR